jgi:hypothetical protein
LGPFSRPHARAGPIRSPAVGRTHWPNAAGARLAQLVWQHGPRAAAAGRRPRIATAAVDRIRHRSADHFLERPPLDSGLLSPVQYPARNRPTGRRRATTGVR